MTPTRTEDRLARWLVVVAVIVTTIGATWASGLDDEQAPAEITLNGDLSVTTDEDRTTLTVASFDRDFVVVLPYQDQWVLESDKNSLLTGRSSRYTVALVRRDELEGDARDVLNDALDELLIDGVDIRFLEFIERHERTLLAFQVRYSENGPRYRFYWLLFPAGAGWLQLTIVDAAPGELAPVDIDLVEIMTRSTTVTEVLGPALD